MTSGYSRFAYDIIADKEGYLACNLDEGILRYWEMPRKRFAELRANNRLIKHRLADVDGRYLAMSRKQELEQGTGRCIGYQLTANDISSISALLEDVLDLVVPIISDLPSPFAIVPFYAESNSGLPPIEVVESWHLQSNPPFQRLEEYIEGLVPYMIHGPNPEEHWNRQMDAGKKAKHVRQALANGILGVEDLLLHGKQSQVELIDTLAEQPITFEFDEDGYVIEYGRATLRWTGAYKKPRFFDCLGRQGTLGQR